MISPTLQVNEQCRDFRVPAPLETLAPPDDFLADGDVVQWGPELTVKCLHCPGHTPGSLSYFFEQHKVVCPGDTLFQGSVGRTSWAGFPSLQGTSDACHGGLKMNMCQKMGCTRSSILQLSGFENRAPLNPIVDHGHQFGVSTIFRHLNNLKWPFSSLSMCLKYLETDCAGFLPPMLCFPFPINFPSGPPRIRI